MSRPAEAYAPPLTLRGATEGCPEGVCEQTQRRGEAGGREKGHVPELCALAKPHFRSADAC